MALIYPDNPVFKNHSEEFVYNYIKNKLPNGYVSYFNYNIGIREFDFAVLIPNYGIAILEVKGWKSEKIIKVKDNNCIWYGQKGKPPIPMTSPLKQADGYRYELVNIITKELNKNFMVLPLVCYPYITYEDYSIRELNKVSSDIWTVTKDDFKESVGLENKLLNLFKHAKKTLNLRNDEFDSSNVKLVRGLFEPQSVEAAINEEDIASYFGFGENEDKDNLESYFGF